MSFQYFYLAILIGTFLSLLTEEAFGISCGGIIVPGYLALVCDDLGAILMILLISLLTYLIVDRGLSKVMVLFGRRRFAITLLVGILLKLIAEFFFPILPFASIAIQGFGAVTPALLANTYARQGIRYTLPACAVVTLLCFFAINGLAAVL